MIQYICDICNQPQNESYEIQIRHTTDHTSVETKHLCNTCYNKLLEQISNKEPENQEENIPEPNSNSEQKDNMLPEEKIPKFYDYEQDYQGMLLRDFLNSSFYLDSKKKFLFCTTENKIIQDYEFWMPRQILTVHPPTAAHDEIIVTLL